MVAGADGRIPGPGHRHHRRMGGGGASAQRTLPSGASGVCLCAERIEALLASELAAPPGKVFAWFDPEPLAAGSKALVHRAPLSSGEQVVVKVRRPGSGPWWSATWTSC
jgi:ABC1 atypical kinase-like domain